MRGSEGWCGREKKHDMCEQILGATEDVRREMEGLAFPKCVVGSVKHRKIMGR